MPCSWFAPWSCVSLCSGDEHAPGYAASERVEIEQHLFAALMNAGRAGRLDTRSRSPAFEEPQPATIAYSATFTGGLETPDLRAAPAFSTGALTAETPIGAGACMAPRLLAASSAKDHFDSF